MAIIVLITLDQPQNIGVHENFVDAVSESLRFDASTRNRMTTQPHNDSKFRSLQSNLFTVARHCDSRHVTMRFSTYIAAHAFIFAKGHVYSIYIHEYVTQSIGMEYKRNNCKDL